MYLRKKRQRRVQKLAQVYFLFPLPSIKAPGYMKALLCIDMLGKSGTVYENP